jgi:hypothetical protein
MKITKIAMACAFMMLISSSISFAQGWRGIVPLHSTCIDVKRVLGVAKCEPSIYYLEDEIVNINFSEKPCHEKWPYEKWNVPPGVVTSISVRLKKQPPLANLGIDITNYKKVPDEYSTGGHIYYNEEKGVAITADADGKVLEISYQPTAKDSYRHCPYTSGQWSGVGKRVEGTPAKIDEYSDIDFSKEKEHLDKLAHQLSQSGPNALGYIIAYSGRRAHVGEAQARADRAKDYLVKRYNIEAGRLVTVDGGYREKRTVEIWFGFRGMTAPNGEPTVHPKEVRIIGGRARNNDRVHPGQNANRP